ncbi:MAG: hypothetical protein QFB89_06400 [Pseudomonadota bacterium]|nr:hypothetical protein [Pseudomonadota bacterium]
MASPLHSAKPIVNLAPRGVGQSRIRRDPPPPVKKTAARSRGRNDSWTVIAGILLFELAFLILFIALTSYDGWSPSQYVIHF